MKRLFVLIVSLFATLICFSQRVGSVKITELETIIAESKTPLIINFWATWCKPCLEEIPYFEDEVTKHYKDSMKLLLVSLDFKEAFPQGISTFAKKREIKGQIFWLNETNADYFCPKIDPKWSGAIPATLFINNKRGYRHFVEAQISHEKLKQEIMALLEIR